MGSREKKKREKDGGCGLESRTSVSLCRSSPSPSPPSSFSLSGTLGWEEVEVVELVVVGGDLAPDGGGVDPGDVILV